MSIKNKIDYHSLDAESGTDLELNGKREREEDSEDRPSKRMKLGLVPTSELFKGLEELEKILNYYFHNKNLLLEALILTIDKSISPLLRALGTSRGRFSRYSIEINCKHYVIT